MPLAYGLMQPLELYFPGLPRRVDGWRVAHISDLHVTRAGSAVASRLVNQLARVRVDLVALTGDYMTKRRPSEPAVAALRQIVTELRPRHGFVGVFGNHDDAVLRDAVADLPVRWLRNSATAIVGWPVDVWGMDCGRVAGGDSVKMALDAQGRPSTGDGLAADEHRLRLMLAHYPDALLPAAELGVDLLLAGHTHGGQVRLPAGLALVNSTGLPLGMSAGVLRHLDATIAISRGLGSHTVPFRTFCPPHVPVYTLRRGTQTDRCETVSVWRRW